MSDRREGRSGVEERKLRPDTNPDSGPLHRFLTDGFDASAEVLLFSLPFFLYVAARDDPFYSFLVVFALFGLVASVATLRGNRLTRLPRWPSNSPWHLAVRFGVYNLVLPVAVAVGGVAQFGPGRVAWTSGPVILPGLVACVVAGLLAVSVPPLSRLVRR